MFVLSNQFVSEQIIQTSHPKLSQTVSRLGVRHTYWQTFYWAWVENFCVKIKEKLLPTTGVFKL